MYTHTGMEKDSPSHLCIHNGWVDNNRCSQDIVQEQGIMIETRILQILTSREFSLFKRNEAVIYGKAHR